MQNASLRLVFSVYALKPVERENVIFEKCKKFSVYGLKGVMRNLSLGDSLSLFRGRIILVVYLVHAVFHFVVFRIVLNSFEANKKHVILFIHSFTTIHSFTC